MKWQYAFLVVLVLRTCQTGSPVVRARKSTWACCVLRLRGGWNPSEMPSKLQSLEEVLRKTSEITELLSAIDDKIEGSTMDPVAAADTRQCYLKERVFPLFAKAVCVMLLPFVVLLPFVKTRHGRSSPSEPFFLWRTPATPMIRALFPCQCAGVQNDEFAE